MGWDDVEDVEADSIPVPGSRPRRQVNAAAVAEVQSRLWDAHPRVYRVNGKDTQLFAIGALAKALGRQVVTVRSWERRGWLPAPVLRSPGEGAMQHRLYSRAFIEGVVRIATEENLMKPGTIVKTTDFPRRVRALFQEVGG